MFIFNKFIQHQNVRDRGDKIVIWMITRSKMSPILWKEGREISEVLYWEFIFLCWSHWKSEKALRWRYIYEPFLSASLFFALFVSIVACLSQSSLSLVLISCLCFPLRLDKLWGVLWMIFFGFLKQTERFVSEYILVNNYQGNKQSTQSNTHTVSIKYLLPSKHPSNWNTLALSRKLWLPVNCFPICRWTCHFSFIWKIGS